MKLKLPPKNYSPRYTLEDYIVEEAKELAPGLARAGCCYDNIDWESLTTAQKQAYIKTHFIGLKGECAFWGSLGYDPCKGIETAKLFVETLEPTCDANLFGAEIEIKTQSRQQSLTYAGLRVPLDQWKDNQYDVYFHIYQHIYTPPSKPIKRFCITGFARRFEVAQAKTKHSWDREGNYYEYKWIHYHYLHSHVHLRLWNTYERIPTLKGLTYKYPPYWLRKRSYT
jgi:hypothetical protein